VTDRRDTRTMEAPPGSFRAIRDVPGDKSLSHRALIFSALARGTSEIAGLGPGRDVAATGRLLRSLGVTIAGGRIFSAGVEAWAPPEAPLQCENSGTTMRLMAGALAGRPFGSTLVGDGSLSARPMRRMVAPLGSLGAHLSLTEAGTAPIEVAGTTGLTGCRVSINVASAQVRSCFTLAALQADGPSSIESPAGFRDHTERWLETLGRGERVSGTEFRIDPGPLPPGRYLIARDPSSAAFLWTAAAIRPGNEITTPGVSLNPGRIGFLEVLERMGAEIEAEVTDSVGGDPVGDVTVRGAPLRSTEVSGTLTVAALDELPLVAILGAMAEGITRVQDAAELRTKESDRIASTVEMIRSLGGVAEASADGFEVVGLGWLESGSVDAAGDHRLAMAAAVASLGTRGSVTIEGADVADVSWPGFYDELEQTWSSR
jgi:3-phosphoshikimate 1-carboxyvinyltransferase